MVLEMVSEIQYKRITGFVTRETRVEQGLLTIPEHLLS